MPTPSDRSDIPERSENPANTPDVVVEAVFGAKSGNPPVVSEDGETHPASEPPEAPEGEVPDETPPAA
jgi:hypothetical protein